MSKELVQEAFNAQNKPKYTKKRFAYSGFMVCGKCGCAITAEIQKGKYVYYHCTGFKGKCSDNFIREEELTRQVADVVKKVHIDDLPLPAVKQTTALSAFELHPYRRKSYSHIQKPFNLLAKGLHCINWGLWIKRVRTLGLSRLN